MHLLHMSIKNMLYFDQAKNTRPFLQVLFQSLTVISHCVTAAHHIFEMIWNLCLRLLQESEPDLTPVCERLCTCVLRCAVHFYSADNHVTNCIKVSLCISFSSEQYQPCGRNLRASHE